MKLGGLARLAHPLRAWRYAKLVAGPLRRSARAYGVSLGGLMAETVRLHRNHWISPTEYVALDLADPRYRWEEKTRLIGAQMLGKIERALNPRRYQYVFKNKLVFRRVFEGASLRMTPLLGLFDPVYGWVGDGQPLRTVEDLDRWIREAGAVQPVFKPVESAEGRMILVFRGHKESQSGVLVTLDGREYDARALYEHMTNQDLLARAYSETPPCTSFLIEERIQQNDALKELCGETVCCIRLITLVKVMGEAEVLSAEFKMQPLPVGADNVAQGALTVDVDLRTGELGEGIYEHEDSRTRYTVHPASRKTFTGFKFPFWQEMKERACRAALVFPQCKNIGWDFAFGSEGPILVEGNWFYGLPARGARMTESLWAAYQQAVTNQGPEWPR